MNNKKQINDFSNIYTDEIFNQLVKELNLENSKKIHKVKAGDIKCE